jgi:peptidoglycan pentaglycine glycine transferase (the first glycine)
VDIQILPTKDGRVFQSNFWNNFQKAADKDTFQVAGVFGQVHQHLFLGASAYAPRFPGEAPSQDQIQALCQEAKKNKWIFLRLEPQDDSFLDVVRQNTFGRIVPAEHSVQPQEILMLDITKREEELLAEMKSKTRYNIRLAQKKGVVVEATRDPKDIEAFLDIMEQTAERKNIHFHPRGYYQKFLEYFSEEHCQLLVAKKNNRVLAGAIILFYGQTAYYLHGGSGDEGRNLMAPHLLQWTGIQYAKQKGCTRYDFGGVAVKTLAPTGKDWKGITRFKQGFAPNTDTFVFPGAFDIVYKPLRYQAYRIISFLRSYV